MPRNGSGGYLPPQNSWNPAINGAQALPNDWMAILNDVAATLQASTAADGQTPITGVWNFGNNRISNVGAPIGQGDALRWEQLTKGPDIESAATISIPVEGQVFDVTGTTTITTINDAYPGRVVMLRFADAVTITHSVAMELPTGVSATTSPGDVIVISNVEPGVWRVISWPRFSSSGYPSSVTPTITWPYMLWSATGSQAPRRRNATNTGWLQIVGEERFMTAGTFTFVAKSTTVFVDLVGGGGAGGDGGYGSALSGGGGASGSAGEYRLGVRVTGLTIGANVTVTVGARGERSSTGSSPSPGGASSFGSFVTVSGGPAGGSASTSAGGVALTSGNGHNGANGLSSSSSEPSGAGGTGGDSPFGRGGAGGGRTGSNTTVGIFGNDGAGNGSGGGGASGSRNIGNFARGGNGAPGAVIVRWFEGGL